jgi:hypothetical protein
MHVTITFQPSHSPCVSSLFDGELHCQGRDKCAVFGVYSRQQQRTLVKVLLEDKQYVLFAILISLIFYEN